MGPTQVKLQFSLGVHKFAESALGVCRIDVVIKGIYEWDLLR